MAFDFSSSFSGINSALQNIGKQNERAWQMKALGEIGKDINTGNLSVAAQKLFGLGEFGSATKLLELGQAAKDREADAGLLRGLPGLGAAPVAPPSPAAAIGNPNEIENRFVNTVKGAGLTNPVGLGAVAAYGKAESGFSPQNVNRSWNDPSESGQPGTPGGIMSWRAERLQNLQRFAQQRGEQQPSVETQALFLAQENPQLIPALQAAKTPQEANQIMANAWRFAGYNREGGENARRLALTQQYAQRFGGQAGPSAAIPVQVAENEADVQRLEAQQGNPVVDAPTAAPVQVAQAPAQPDAPVADAPAPGAAPAQGFAIPGTDVVVPGSLMDDQRVRALSGALLQARTEKARTAIKGQLDLAVKDAERRMASSAPTETVRNYQFYSRQEQAAGRQPMSFQQFRESTRSQTNVNMPPAEKEYDKQSAKDFAEMNRDMIKGAQTANQKIATLNRLDTLLANPSIRTGAGAQLALQASRMAKAVFGVETEGLGGAEAVNAIANQFALELRNPSGGAGMPGALSDKDREFLQQSTPGLERTPEGNKLIIDFMRRVAKRSVDVERLRRDYIRENKRLDEGFFEKLAEFSEANPLFPEASADPAAPAAAAAPSPPRRGELVDGYRFKGGDASDPKNWHKVR